MIHYDQPVSQPEQHEHDAVHAGCAVKVNEQIRARVFVDVVFESGGEFSHVVAPKNGGISQNFCLGRVWCKPPWPLARQVVWKVCEQLVQCALDLFVSELNFQLGECSRGFFHWSYSSVMAVEFGGVAIITSQSDIPQPHQVVANKGKSPNKAILILY